MSNPFTISLPQDLAQHFIEYRDDITNPDTLTSLVRFGLIHAAIATPESELEKNNKIKTVAVRLRTHIKYPNYIIVMAIRFHKMIVAADKTVEEFITSESATETFNIITESYTKATDKLKAENKKRRTVKPKASTHRKGTSVSRSKSDKSRQILVSFRDDINKNALLYYAVKYVNDIIAPNGRKSDPEKFQLRGDLLRRAQEFNAAHPEAVVTFKHKHLVTRAAEYNIDNIIDEKERDKARAIIADIKRGGAWTYVDKSYTDKLENRIDYFYSLYIIVPGLLDEVCEKLHKPDDEDAQQ
nr:MAG TPA: hypothetical protein [Caudoviricetes sp.]